MADITVTARSVRPLPAPSPAIRDFIAGGTVNVGDAVYVDSTGKVQQANAAALATAKEAGIALSAGSIGATTAASGDTVSVLVFGAVNGFSGLTAGAKIYVSAATAGKFADAAPAGAASVTWLAGIALAADTILFEPLAPDPQAAVANLTDAFGTADGTVADVGAAFNQGTLNDNFQEMSTKIASILAALRSQGILVR